MSKWLFALLMFACSVQADTYQYKLKVNSDIDSLRTYLDSNGVQVKTWKTTGRQTIDTTITYTADKYWQIYTYIYYTGSDSAASYEKHFGSWRGTNWKIHPHWQDETDTSTLFFYTDGSLTATKGRNSQQSYDSAFTVALSHLYQIEIFTKYSGDDSATNTSYLLNTDTSAIIEVVPSPSDTFHTMVWGYTRDGSGDTLPYCDVIFTLKRSVNNSCDSTIVVQSSVKTKSNAAGYFQKELIVSRCLLAPGNASDSLNRRVKWGVKFVKGAFQTDEHTFILPDTGTSYQVYW